jgi:hypothetical protein
MCSDVLRIPCELPTGAEALLKSKSVERTRLFSSSSMGYGVGLEIMMHETKKESRKPQEEKKKGRKKTEKEEEQEQEDERAKTRSQAISTCLLSLYGVKWESVGQLVVSSSVFFFVHEEGRIAAIQQITTWRALVTTRY